MQPREACRMRLKCVRVVHANQCSVLHLGEVVMVQARDTQERSK